MTILVHHRYRLPAPQHLQRLRRDRLLSQPRRPRLPQIVPLKILKLRPLQNRFPRLAAQLLDGLAIKGGATSALEMGSRSNLPIEIDAHFVLDGLFDFGLGCAVPVLVQPLRKVGGAHAYRTGELRLRLARLGDSRTHRPAQLRAAHPSDRFGRVRHRE